MPDRKFVLRPDMDKLREKVEELRRETEKRVTEIDEKVEEMEDKTDSFERLVFLVAAVKDHKRGLLTADELQSAANEAIDGVYTGDLKPEVQQLLQPLWNSSQR